MCIFNALDARADQVRLAREARAGLCARGRRWEMSVLLQRSSRAEVQEKIAV